MAVKAGSAAEVSLEISPLDTAVAHRSGDVEVLATPRLIALCEEACVKAVEGQLGEGETTVGMRVQFDHLRPLAIGRKVTVEAVLTRVEGRRLTFTATAYDEAGVVGAGVFTRVLVQREEFLSKAT
jgi:fluoroacetyl-CoA thioesterase